MGIEGDRLDLDRLAECLDRMGEWRSRFDPDEDDTAVTIYVDDKGGVICPIATVGGQQMDEYDDLDTDATAARFAILIREAPNLYRQSVEARDRIRELIDKEELTDAAVNWLESIADDLDDRIGCATEPHPLA